MNKLAIWLAKEVLGKVQGATQGYSSINPEYRLIFRGPPLEILEQTYSDLTQNGGIQVQGRQDGSKATLPVLLQYPGNQLQGPKPLIGQSGKCDNDHLLNVRNDPTNPSFVALVPPGLHNNLSIESTTDEFGLGSDTSTGSTSFDIWWRDEFVQQAVEQALTVAGVDPQQKDDAKALIEKATGAVDEIDPDKSSHRLAWHLLSRIYSIASTNQGLPAGQALALACGFPPMEDGKISPKIQQSTLDKISEELADGFKTGIERLTANATPETDKALRELLAHLQSNCDIPTAFERATAAFYLPNAGLELTAPPSWWTTLTIEQWTELLSNEENQAIGEVAIQCTNGIIPINKGMPALVRGQVELAVSTSEGYQPQEVQLTGGSQGKAFISLPVALNGPTRYSDSSPPAHKTPMSYKVIAGGSKPASIRVISLETWQPGIVVSCRLATKSTPPKKPRKKSAKLHWETALSLPGSGRYELRIHLSPGVSLGTVEGLSDDTTEIEAGKQDIETKQVGEDEYLIEIEADGKYQLDIAFTLPGEKAPSICRAYLACEETKEEGCRSEFERLIKLNRRHLEKFDTKAVVHLERNSRASSLQSWMLEEQNAAISFRPLVISNDYASQWAPPDWNAIDGPILSRGQFLHDPRPQAEHFQPPKGFIEARQELAKYIRGEDQSGLLESAPLGAWLSNDPDFRSLVESYLDSFMSWVSTNPSVACWVDTVIVCSLQADGRTLDRIPDAIILSPLHPLRLAWHCLAQKVLRDEVEGDSACPCPAASILDPDCIPDLLTLCLQSPSGEDSVDFLSVECSSDYWSVLWNGSRLNQIPERTSRAPFDSSLGLTVGGISSGFSPAQVSRALDDVTDLLSAKPIVSLVVSSAGGTTDACNEGLANWCTKRFGNGDQDKTRQSVGARILEVFDTRKTGVPDQATIANLSEDTDNHVRWYDKQPVNSKPDLGIIAQLNSADPESKEVGILSPLSVGGLIRHRVRRQLKASFLSESRQGLQMPLSGDPFADKVSTCMLMLEKIRDGKVGLQFSPNTHAISGMLEGNSAGFVAVSSSAIDPACFLGGWIEGTYLWDYDLPAYSHRAGDTSGYYLLSQVKEADRDALRRVLKPLPDCGNLDDNQIEQILLEVARRGIPTVRGLSGDDTGATGDLGLFLAVRLLQDQFRQEGNLNSLLPVLAGTPEDSTIAIIIPVDPFRGYLSDLARSLGKERKEMSLSRPDLLAVGVRACNDRIQLHLTPIEVKCRQNSVFSSGDSTEALNQAKALSTLLRAIEERATTSLAWRLAFQHLLLSMIGFGLRVYSQHQAVDGQAGRWASYHERIAAAILNPTPTISIDEKGRLIVVDGSPDSDSHDRDGDGYAETIVISSKDAGRMIVGNDAQSFYDSVRSKVNDWGLLPASTNEPSSPTSKSTSIVEAPVLSEEQTGTPASEPGEKANGSSLELIEQSSTTTSSPMAAPATPVSSGIVLSVGKTVDGFEPRPLTLNISNTQLNQLNIGVVGDLGTGKTQFLKSLILQISRSRDENRGITPRFLIFDYKRDYSSDDFVKATGAKVVKPYRLPLNLFDTTGMGESSAPWLDRFRFFSDVLDKVYTGIGPVQRDKLKKAVRNAYDTANAENRQPTIYDIHEEYSQLLAGKSDSPMAIIDDLVDMEVFARDGDIKPFDEFLDGVVVISLDAMGQDDRSKNMLVAVMLNMFYENMLRTPKRPFIGDSPQLRAIDSYLLVDEADNIMRYEFDVLRKLLLQGREFGAGVILASQYLRHFKAGATDYRDPLLTWFIHKVPNATPNELGALGFTSDLAELSERVKTLPNHHCLYKSFDATGEVIRGLPFFELTSQS
ncbi:ATP-binding protein [Pseudomonas vanderleydeniana]|uniref:ATP-binding protein n=1 Tax=Pseudomonas vanderleydeniana TaxID=2745495 RepID=A0A9E6PH71_9PSED|nr:ATP-binding protein [Pseudomonas vanderleydeniana]QXI26418.1 ATP-binding protein [Pseudomonas vanderleydeniana]